MTVRIKALRIRLPRRLAGEAAEIARQVGEGLARLEVAASTDHVIVHPIRMGTDTSSNDVARKVVANVRRELSGREG